MNFQVRIHGRGGQGVVTAAEMLSVAAFLEGRHAQALPSFGSERTGAPVVAFCRIDDRSIRTREPVEHPDAVVILDPTLLHSVDLFSGLDAGGHVLVNSSRTFDELGIGELAGRFQRAHLLTVPATELAMTHVGRPLPNAVMLGGLCAVTAVASMDSLAAAIRQRFAGAIAEGNLAGATAAYEHVGREQEALVHA